MSTRAPLLRTLPTLAGAALLCALAGAAQAQVYKWVDAAGKTHYSNTPPANPKSAKRIEEAGERVTVYTPDPALSRALDARARPERSDARTEARVEKLERDLEAERAARRAREEEVRTRQMAEAERRAAEAERMVLPGAPYYYAPIPVPVTKRRQAFAPPYDTGRFYGPDASAAVGVSTAPPVGVSTAPKAGISTAPPAGRPVHSGDGFRR